MKRKICITSILVIASISAMAQGIYNNSGARFTFSGSPYVVVNNGGYLSSGGWTKGSETLQFTGTTASDISGIADDYNDIIVANSGGITLTASGTNTADNLTVSSGSFTLPATKQLTVNTALSNSLGNSGLLLKSDASGNASLIQNNNVSASVELYLTGSKWHLLSSPVTANTNSVYTNMYMKQYSEAANAFGDFVSATNIALTPGTGNVIWATNTSTVNYSGFLNAGSIGPISCPRASQGFTLVGNPYTSAIDWNAASGWTKTNLGASIWIWNGTQYATWNGAAGTNGGSRYISMGQGFFVQASAAGSLTMTSAVQVHNGVSLLKSAKVQVSQLRAKISGNAYSDEAIVLQADDALSEIDYRYDALKMMGIPEAPQLFILKDNKNFAMASISEIDSTTQIPLCLKVGVEAEYTLSLQNNLYFNELKLLLRDSKRNTITEVTENFRYTCQASPSDDSARFILEFKTTDVANALLNISASKISVWNAGQLLNIDIPSNETLTKLEIYDINGRKLLSRNKLSGSTLEMNLPPALYIVSVSTDKQFSNHKIVIR